METQSTASRRWMVLFYVLPLLGGLAWSMWSLWTVGFPAPMRLDSVVAAVLQGGALVLLIKYTNRRLPFTWGHVIALVAWGFFIVGLYGLAVAVSGATLLRSWSHIDATRASDAEIAVFGPLVEEASKALGVLWAFTFLPRRAWALAGFFYVSLIGVGFATFENITHFNSNGVTWATVWARLPGYFSHPIYTSCFVALLGVVWAERRKWLSALMGVLGWLLGSGLHMMSNMTNVRDADSTHARVFSPVVWLFMLVVVSRLSPAPSQTEAPRPAKPSGDRR